MGVVMVLHFIVLIQCLHYSLFNNDKELFKGMLKYYGDFIAGSTHLVAKVS